MERSDVAIRASMAPPASSPAAPLPSRVAFQLALRAASRRMATVDARADLGTPRTGPRSALVSQGESRSQLPKLDGDPRASWFRPTNDGFCSGAPKISAMPSQTFVRRRTSQWDRRRPYDRPPRRRDQRSRRTPPGAHTNVARRTDKPGKEHGLLLCDVLIATSLRGHSPANVSLRISDLSRSSLDAQ
jgi:hypothetical protein